MSQSRTKFIKITLAVVTLLVVTCGIGYFWYMHTPYFAVQQIATAIARKDANTFYEYCDAKGVVTSLTDQLFFQPAMSTRGMSQFQNFVAAGAIVMTKTRMDIALLHAIDRMFVPIPNTSFYHVFPDKGFRHGIAVNVYDTTSDDRIDNQTAKIVLVARHETGQEQERVQTQRQKNKQTQKQKQDHALAQDQVQEQEEKLNLRDFASSVGRELKSEQNDLKELAAKRMHEYAAAHQNELIGRILAGPTQGASMRDLLNDYGFQSKNFKKLYFRKDDDREICTVEFFSPKVNANVPISVELVPVAPAEVFSKWRVARMWKLKETMTALGEDTDTQVCDLFRFSLQDISPEQAATRTRNLLERITKEKGAKQLLEQLKDRL